MSSEHIIFLGTMSDRLPAVVFDESSRTLRKTADQKVEQLPNWIIHHPHLPNGVLYNSAMESKLFAATYDRNGSLSVVDEIKQLPEHIRPCHMEATNDKSAVVLANYGSGTVSIIPLGADGQFGKQEPSHTFIPPGKYIKGHPQHSQGHAHQIIVRGDEILVPDLGANNVWRLRYEDGTLVQSGVIEGFEIGDGPRHAVVHPNGRVIYVLCQTSSELVACSLPQGSQPSRILSRRSVIPPEDQHKMAEMLGAAIVYLPPIRAGGKGLLLCTNRNSGHPDGDAITLYTVDDEGELSPAPTPFVRAADTMRGMVADKTGRWICVAGQKDANIIVYERTGEAEIAEVARVAGIPDVCSPTWV